MGGTLHYWCHFPRLLFCFFPIVLNLGSSKFFFFFFKQSKSSFCKEIFLTEAKTVKISPYDYNLQWQTSIPRSLLPTTLFLCLLVRHSFSTQVLKKCILLVSSIWYRIPAPPFLILHMYYDYRESSLEANSPHVPPKTLVLWLIPWLHFWSEIFPFWTGPSLCSLFFKLCSHFSEWDTWTPVV